MQSLGHRHTEGPGSFIQGSSKQGTTHPNVHEQMHATTNGDLARRCPLLSTEGAAYWRAERGGLPKPRRRERGQAPAPHGPVRPAV